MLFTGVVPYCAELPVLTGSSLVTEPPLEVRVYTMPKLAGNMATPEQMIHTAIGSGEIYVKRRGLDGQVNEVGIAFRLTRGHVWWHLCAVVHKVWFVRGCAQT